jgi:1-phosphofructokinase family hexose kinase
VIRVVGPNPAMDRIEVLQRLDIDAVNRSVEVHVVPGGKGLNVARGIRALGGGVAVYGFAGGLVGGYLRDSCAALGIDDRHTAIAGETRICTILVERDSGRSTVVNEPGPSIAPQEQEALVASLAADCRPDDLVLLSGSIPIGVPPGFYPELIARAQGARARVIVDTAGPALVESLRCGPWMVKLNLREFGEAVGADFDTYDNGPIMDAMRRQLDAGSTAVVVTRSADGLLAMTADAAWEVAVPRVVAVNSTGSGDLLLAGLATQLAAGGDLERAIVIGAACGVANAMSVTPELRADIDLLELAGQVRIERLRQAT